MQRAPERETRNSKQNNGKIVRYEMMGGEPTEMMGGRQATAAQSEVIMRVSACRQVVLQRGGWKKIEVNEKLLTDMNHPVEDVDGVSIAYRRSSSSRLIISV